MKNAKKEGDGYLSNHGIQKNGGMGIYPTTKHTKYSKEKLQTFSVLFRVFRGSKKGF